MTAPAGHLALLRRADVLRAAAPALAQGAVAVVLEPGVDAPPSVATELLRDGVRVGVAPLDVAVAVASSRSTRAADHLLTPPGPSRAWLLLLAADRRVTVAPLAAPGAPPLGDA